MQWCNNHSCVAQIKGWFIIIDSCCWSSAGASTSTSPHHFIFQGVNVQSWPFIICLVSTGETCARTHARSRQVLHKPWVRLWGIFTPSTEAGWDHVVFTGGPSAKIPAGSQSPPPLTPPPPFFFLFFKIKSVGHHSDASCMFLNQHLACAF